MYSIYCITNTINGKKYVGMTSQSVNERWRKHVSASKQEHNTMYDSPLQEDIREYGKNCFAHQVLATTEDKELAMLLEDEATTILNTHVPNGYNRIVGYHREHTEESKKKISESKSGENHPNYGKHLSEETKKKISKPVMCVETGAIFKGLTEASEWAGLKSVSGISQCCTGRQKTAGNYHWEYALKEE